MGTYCPYNPLTNLLPNFLGHPNSKLFCTNTSFQVFLRNYTYKFPLGGNSHQCLVDDSKVVTYRFFAWKMSGFHLRSSRIPSIAAQHSHQGKHVFFLRCCTESFPLMRWTYGKVFSKKSADMGFWHDQTKQGTKNNKQKHWNSTWISPNVIILKKQNMSNPTF